MIKRAFNIKTPYNATDSDTLFKAWNLSFLNVYKVNNSTWSAKEIKGKEFDKFLSDFSRAWDTTINGTVFYWNNTL